MEIIPRDSDPVASVGDVQLPVVMIHSMARVTVKFVMVDPYVVRLLNSNAIVPNDLVDNDVLYDNVRLAIDLQATTVDDAFRTDPNDSCIAS